MESGRRHSVDVLVSSTFDAADIFVTHAKADPRNGIRLLSVDSVFDVTVGGRFTGSREKPCNNGFSRKGRNAKAPGEFYFCRVLGWMTFAPLVHIHVELRAASRHPDVQGKHVLMLASEVTGRGLLIARSWTQPGTFTAPLSTAALARTAAMDAELSTDCIPNQTEAGRKPSCTTSERSRTVRFPWPA